MIRFHGPFLFYEIPSSAFSKESPLCGLFCLHGLTLKLVEQPMLLNQILDACLLQMEANIAMHFFTVNGSQASTWMDMKMQVVFHYYLRAAYPRKNSRT